MRFVHLIWSGLVRRPVRTLLTLMTSAVAFMLFGLTIGLDASIHRAIEIARLDCIYISGRFGGPLPIAQRAQILKIPHVVNVGYWNWVNGYYRDPKNSAGVLMLDQNEHKIWSELPLSDDQFLQLRTARNGVFVSKIIAAKLDLKAGSPFPVLTTPSSRADGSTVWSFHVLGIFPDLALDPEGLIIGDYAYYDESTTLADRGKVDTFEALVDDPRNAEEASRAIDRLFENSSYPTRSIPEKVFYESGNLSGIAVSDIGLVTKGTATAGIFMILFLLGNTIAQSARERRVEFAVMKAVGFSDRLIILIIFGEAIVPALLGAAIGLLLAVGASPIWPRVVPTNWAIPQPAISSYVIITAVSISLIISFICALIPSLRLRQMDLATALAGR